jgi:hypothetical protein
MPPPPLRVTLDPVAQAELDQRYQTTSDAETWDTPRSGTPRAPAK